MKTVVKAFMMAAVALPAMSFAATPQLEAKQDSVVLTSPRTGIRYTLTNTENRPVVFKTAELQPANQATVSRIAANNPALSAASQEKAKQALVSSPIELAVNR